MATKKFPSELSSRGTVLTTDKLLIHNITSGATEYTTVAALLATVTGTKYWSCPGNAFNAQAPLTGNITKSITGSVIANNDGISLVGTVNLPNGATITSAKMTGNAAASAETWTLLRIAVVGLAQVVMATADINTEDTTITSAVIDNSLYAYFFYTSTIDSNDTIYGALISYTS